MKEINIEQLLLMLEQWKKDAIRYEKEQAINKEYIAGQLSILNLIISFFEKY